jgi:hypothetical protein
MALRGWAKLSIHRRCPAIGGHSMVHSAWSATPKALDGDPYKAGALLYFHFTNPNPSETETQARAWNLNLNLDFNLK